MTLKPTTVEQQVFELFTRTHTFVIFQSTYITVNVYFLNSWIHYNWYLDFRLPPRCRWGLPSSGLLCSVCWSSTWPAWPLKMELISCTTTSASTINMRRVTTHHLWLTSFTVDIGHTGGRVRPVNSTYCKIPTLTYCRCCQLKPCNSTVWLRRMNFSMRALEGEKNTNVAVFMSCQLKVHPLRYCWLALTHTNWTILLQRKKLRE
jgi:hypothetical protein